MYAPIEIPDIFIYAGIDIDIDVKTYLDIAIASHTTGVEFPHDGCSGACFLCDGYVSKEITDVSVNRHFTPLQRPCEAIALP